MRLESIAENLNEGHNKTLKSLKARKSIIIDPSKIIRPVDEDFADGIKPFLNKLYGRFSAIGYHAGSHTHK
jgi:hypothetical protein